MSELTIEQMRQIVDGAPDWAKGYNTAIQKYTRSVWFSKDILLSDLKAKIDQHYYGQSEEKELEQYAILSQEKIEGGAMLVGGLSIQKMVDYQDVIASQQSEIDRLKAEKAVMEKRLNAVDEIMNDYYTGSFEDAPDLAGWISTALRGEHE